MNALFNLCPASCFKDRINEKVDKKVIFDRSWGGALRRTVNIRSGIRSSAEINSSSAPSLSERESELD